MKSATVRVLADTPNAPVLQLETRKYPGILIQGDTMASLLACARRAVSAGDWAEAKGEAEFLASRLADLLDHYEDALRRAGMELPYVKEG